MSTFKFALTNLFLCLTFCESLWYLIIVVAKRININRLHPNFRSCIYRYLADTGKSQKDLAAELDIQESVLSELLTGHPRRPLTAHYLELFLDRGICTVDQVCDGNVISKAERAFWLDRREREEWVAMLIEAKEKNVDVKDMVRKILDTIKIPRVD